MSVKLTWQQRAAKRMVAESALRMAIEEIEKARPTGGPTSGPGGHYVLAKHLVQHASDQLRLSEGRS